MSIPRRFVRSDRSSPARAAVIPKIGARQLRRGAAHRLTSTLPKPRREYTPFGAPLPIRFLHDAAAYVLLDYITPGAPPSLERAQSLPRGSLFSL